MSWHLGRLCGFDLETTGVDVEQDHIVTACVVQCGGKHPTTSATWMANPGIEIPEGAAAVHGITTEQAQAEGQPAGQVVEQVVAALVQVVLSGIPVVAMNASFDLTMLDREARRHRIMPLTDRVGDSLRVVDPRIIDKQVDTYRPGKRTLTDLCRLYEVPLNGAHSADRVGGGAGGQLPGASAEQGQDGRHRRFVAAASGRRRGMKLRLPFVPRRSYDRVAAEGAYAAEELTAVSIVNERLTEDLAKTKAQVLEEHEAHRQAIADAIGYQDPHLTWDRLTAVVAHVAKVAGEWQADHKVEKDRADLLAAQLNDAGRENGRLQVELRGAHEQVTSGAVAELRAQARREQKRADQLQKQYDEAVGLVGNRPKDSRHWQPGYKADAS